MWKGCWFDNILEDVERKIFLCCGFLGWLIFLFVFLMVWVIVYCYMGDDVIGFDRVVYKGLVLVKFLLSNR